MVKYLIVKHGFSPNEEVLGKLPIHTAAKYGAFNTLEYLSGLPGIDLNAKDRHGENVFELINKFRASKGQNDFSSIPTDRGKFPNHRPPKKFRMS